MAAPSFAALTTSAIPTPSTLYATTAAHDQPTAALLCSADNRGSQADDHFPEPSQLDGSADRRDRRSGLIEAPLSTSLADGCGITSYGLVGLGELGLQRCYLRLKGLEFYYSLLECCQSVEESHRARTCSNRRVGMVDGEILCVYGVQGLDSVLFIFVFFLTDRVCL